MSNMKVMMHRFMNSSCKKSREYLLHKLQAYAKLSGGVWNHSALKYFNDKLKLFGNQCSNIAAHKVRRTSQILFLYRRLHGDNSARNFYQQLRSFIVSSPAGTALFMLSASFFTWDDNNRVTDKDVERTEHELMAFFDCKTISASSICDEQGEVWEKILDKVHFKLWRCPVKGTSLYKYRVHGSFTDIPARAFYNIQLDLEYRKKWDNHVIRLEKVEEDEETGSEVLYWATHFPLAFLYNRDYIFVRRYKVDWRQNFMLLMAKSVDHPSFPATKEFVRVGTYMSQMLIRPHTSMDEMGFDYVMSYYDNPHLYVPTWAINKMTLSSLPAFIDQLHEAAKHLVKSSRTVSSLQESVGNEQPDQSTIHISSRSV